MLLMLLPAWERGYMALAVHLRASFHCGKRKWPLHIRPPPHRHTPGSLPVLSGTCCSQRHWHFVMWCAPASLSLSLLSRLTNAVRFRNDSKRSSGQFGRRTVDGHQEDVAWRDTRACAPTTLNPSWHHPRTCGEKNVKKGRTERRFSNQTISHFMCGSPPLPLFLSSLHLTLSPFPSL